jgi:ComF family protein
MRALFRSRATESLVSCIDTLPPHTLRSISHKPFPIYSLGRYDTRLWKALTYEIKFHKNRHAVALVSPLVRDALSTLTAHTPACIVPIPLHPSRLRERGFNQVSLCLKNACHDTYHASYIDEDLLVRLRQKKQQKTLNRTKREENIAGAFALAPQRTCVGLDIIIVDDVCATGATVREAARVCMTAGARSVRILTFCNS